VRELSRFERWSGRDEAPQERRHVRAGPLTAELEGPDLRYVRLGAIEVVRRLYAAVRDRNWGTVPPSLSNIELESDDASFALRFDAHNLDPSLAVDFRWHGEIAGAADGTLTCSLDGVAGADFDYNRIGWCVLHPADNAGRAYRAASPDGPIGGKLPDTIGPQLVVDGLPSPIFPSFSELELELEGGVQARFEFEGDLFETEDQRNWTDASFKSYSTPLRLGFPHAAAKGQRIAQSVRLHVGGASPRTRPRGGHIEVRLGVPLQRTLPRLGLSAASHESPLSPREVQLLSTLAVDHVRSDVDLLRDGWRPRLERDLADAKSIGAALELAVFRPPGGNGGSALEELGAALASSGAKVARVLAFAPDESTSSAETVALVRRALQDATRDAPVFGGTNILFTSLNRDRPQLGGLDGVVWPLNATVHADDDTSVAETAAVHGETVRSARSFCGDLPLAVTPVTFNQRFNPVATGPEPEPAPGELPAQVDPRQPSLLGAGWTLVSAKHLAESGAASVTYFETTGWRGVLEVEYGGPAQRFASWPGMVFPIYHVLADLAESRGGELVAIDSTEPLAVEALALRGPAGLRLLVASLQPREQRCRIVGLPAGSASVRRLDEGSFAEAASDPARFRGRSEPVPAAGDAFELELGPYAVATIDLAQ
jgi:hypothetical protein